MELSNYFWLMWGSDIITIIQVHSFQQDAKLLRDKENDFKQELFG